MIDIQAIWNLFKLSPQYSHALKEFEKTSDAELLSKYNPDYFRHISSSAFEELVESFLFYGFSDLERPQTSDDAEEILMELGAFGLVEERQWIVNPEDYSLLVDWITPLSLAASKFAPCFYYPYLYVQRFTDFINACNFIGVDIPTLPKRNDYKARFHYYWEFCKVFNLIREQYKLTYADTCVFFYSFIPYIYKQKEIRSTKATQCWFIGGIISEEDKINATTIWQTNIDTQVGDILVHYETYPISAITSVWRACSNACEDPFFHWKVYAHICDRIEISAITLSELKQDEYNIM